MRSSWLGVVIIALALGQSAKADSIYAFSLGVNLQTTCLPGSAVTINALLLNTGSAPIVFAPSFSSGTPSAQGGSLPFAGIDADGQWSVLNSGFSFADFLSQFGGVSVDPGQAFQFTFGTFQAPTDQPLGTSATPDLNFGIDFTDTITGNLLGICDHGSCDHNGPHPTFTLGNAPSSGDMTYFQAVITDRTPVSVPEPSSWQLIAITAIALAGFLRHRRPTLRSIPHKST